MVGFLGLDDGGQCASDDFERLYEAYQAHLVHVGPSAKHVVNARVRIVLRFRFSACFALNRSYGNQSFSELVPLVANVCGGGHF